MTKKKLCIIASAPMGIISFWKTNIDKLSQHFDVYVVANFDDAEVFSCLKIQGARSVNIERRPTVGTVLKAAKDLSRYFKEMQFDGFISMSSSASLVACIAGRMAKIPFRARIFTGQIWANRTGLGRMIFKMIDRFTVMMNNHYLVDGKSQQEYLIKNGILKEGQSVVLANGSICGVDIEKFKPNAEVRKVEREKLGFKDTDVVITFMGRLNRDKGTYELLEAFNRVVQECKDAKLLLIGNSEGIGEETFAKYDNIVFNRNLKCYGFTKTPYKALQAGDIFCLASYREGFGMSVIEAAGVGLPVIASDAYGLRDSFEEGVTGLKCKVKDVETLYAAMKELCEDESKRKAFGEAGRKRIVEKFSMELVSSAWLDYFDNNIK